MKKLSIAIAALLAMAGAQAATTPLQTGSISNVTTDLVNVPIGSGFNLFNPALGTLTGVTLNWNWTATSTASLVNTSSQSQDFDWTSTLQFRLRDTPLLINTTSNATLFSALNTTLAAGATLNLGTNTVNSGGNIAVSIPVGNFGLFTGSGTSVFTCSTATGSTFVGGGGNINVNQATNAGCGYSIQYTYTPTVVTVPEPSSLALVGLALAGAGLVARRRQA